MEIQSGLNEVIRLMTTVSGLSSLSVMFHVLGYLAFLFYSARKKIEINATSWLMFAYGTFVVVILESQKGATTEMLALPVVCTILSLYIVSRLWREQGFKLPDNLHDRIALGTDVFITVILLIMTPVTDHELISLTEESKQQILSGLLILSGLGSVFCYLPQYRDTRKQPGKDHFLPWLLWGLAYAFLTATTVADTGWNSLLVLYPVMNFFLVMILVWINLLPTKRQTLKHP